MPVNHDRRRYRSRSRIEIMLGGRKARRRVAARDDQRFTVLSAIARAAIVNLWL